MSFDVVSLFTKIPVPEAMQILKDQHHLEDDMLNLIAHYLMNTYFMFNGKRYKQLAGTPMGSPISPVIANIFMRDFEEKAIDGAALKPKLWLRYVDDTFVIWPHGRDTLDSFLAYLNAQHRDIKFTMKVESHNQLPFLDLMVKKQQNGGISHTVYRKHPHQPLPQRIITPSSCTTKLGC